MRIAILWKQLSGYASASFAALAEAGADVMVVHRDATPDAPFDDQTLRRGLPGWGWSPAPNDEQLESSINEFAPDALLVCSWDVGAYRKLSRRWKGRAVRVLCMDNAWMGTPKQWGGRLIAPQVIRPAYDLAFVAGERQATFARYLGFDADRVLWGVYCCESDRFAAVAASREQLSRRFLFVGRLVPVKGVDILAEAYARYRSAVSDPWPLDVAGAGPLAELLTDRPGVELMGFLQPADLPDLLARSGCLVLPSRVEPWGVVIHEAASAGLPIVCTAECGASTRFVLDGYNGAIVPAGDAGALARALTRVSHADDHTLAEMGRASSTLAAQLTTDRWAAYVLERLSENGARRD
jgi:glycosyltransferase involved in cell wall biosynthesis